MVGISKFSSAKDSVEDIADALKLNNEIIMNVGDKFLSVSFSLLDYQTRTHRYAYRIDGIDNDWNYLNEAVIRISSLPYGKFKLRIKAQLESGNWSDKEILIPIKVLKPFYEHTWFWVTSFFGMLILFVLIYFLRTKKLEKDKERLENLVKKRTNSLSEALEERELLLKEIHHRVKNNLQVITGLLQLQKEELQDESAQEAINEGQSRVNSIALIHQNLYQHKDLGNIEFKTFLNDLSNQIAELFQKENKKLAVQLNLLETFIDIDTAVPLGLIVNELLNNSYKYAFQNHNTVIVSISLIEKEKGHYVMVYHDNGPGINGLVDFKNAVIDSI
jgi:two-component sensor histidine kinase